MKYFVLATATAAMLCSFAVTVQCRAEQDRYDVKMTAATTSRPQNAQAAIKLAMGPTSAAHVPGGTATRSSDAASNCPPSDQCPPPQRKAKHRRTHSSRN